MTDWKYDLDDVGPDGETKGEELPPIEKGSPSSWNVLFVLLGVGVALYVLATVLGFA